MAVHGQQSPTVTEALVQPTATARTRLTPGSKAAGRLCPAKGCEPGAGLSQCGGQVRKLASTFGVVHPLGAPSEPGCQGQPSGATGRERARGPSPWLWCLGTPGPLAKTAAKP